MAARRSGSLGSSSLRAARGRAVIKDKEIDDETLAAIKASTIDGRGLANGP